MTARRVRLLTWWFFSWKLLLLLIALFCPGPGYDTSTTILVPNAPESWASRFSKLMRWDSIYFLKAAERGYVYEQEWAFGYGRILSLLSPGISSPFYIGLIGIAISHLSHYLSVLVLYALTQEVFNLKTKPGNNMALLSAALHIVCPAGVFLSAPYAEAPFSFLNFLGFYIYALALSDDRNGRALTRDVQFIVAGCIFAAATMARSNSLFSGCLFAYDAVVGLLGILKSRTVSFSAARRLISVGLGGACLLFGFVIPQYFAYLSYCQSRSPRAWCANTIPSIYTWVQSHYWNVGFLRYWTVSNIPLFIIAAPMLFLLIHSSSWALNRKSEVSQKPGSSDQQFTQDCLVRFALPQLIMTILAITNYHVQIINRIASGYPLLYWWMASCYLQGKNSMGRWFVKPDRILCAMVLYGVIQASLFASFLPPA